MSEPARALAHGAACDARARHRGGTRRADATPDPGGHATSPAPAERRGQAALGLALVAYVPLLLTQRGLVSADTKTYLYLDPAKLLSRAWSMWDPSIGSRHGHPPEHRLPVADGARSTGCSTRSACPTGWRSASGWGTIIFAAGAGVPTCCARSAGARARASRAPRSSTRSRPTCSRCVGPALGHPAAVRRAAVARRAHHPHGPHQGLALPRAVRPRRRAPSAASTPPRCSSSASRRRCGSSTPCGSPARSSLRQRRCAPRAHRRCSPSACRCGGSPGCGRRAPTASRSCATPRPPRPWRRCRSATRCCAASATGSSTAATGSAPGSSRASTTRSFLPLLGAHLPRSRSLGLAGGVVARWRHRAYFVLLLAVGTRSRSARTRGTTRRPGRGPLKAFLLSDVGLAMRSLPRAVPLVAPGARGAARRRRHQRWPAAGPAVGAGARRCGGRCVAVLDLPPLWTGRCRARQPAAARGRSPTTGTRPPPTSTPQGDDTRVLGRARRRLRQLPVGQHGRPCPARADGPAVGRSAS